MAEGWNRSILFVFALVSILCAVAIGISYFAPRPKTAIQNPAVPSTSVWKPIAERVQQAERGEFPISEGTLTFSKTSAAADMEVRSVVGNYALPTYAAAQLESGESWGVSGLNRDEFMMYVHNFLNASVSAMLVRISDGTCASFTPQTPARWASAYWSDDLPGGKEAVFQATLPQSYNLESYCAVIVRIYSSHRP